MGLINQVEATRPEQLGGLPPSQPIAAPSERFHNHLAKARPYSELLPTSNAPGAVASSASTEPISILAAEYALQAQFGSIDS